MFAYLEGILEDIENQRVILDVNGIGYELTVPLSTVSKLPVKGEKVRLYTYLNVREDIQELYGFSNKEEKGIFEKLISVSGIGPKTAIAILSVLTSSQLAMAIAMGDTKLLCSAPGIGKKTAQRIILELKEKIDSEWLLRQEPKSLGQKEMESNEVIQALIALGYQPAEARRALAGIKDQNLDVPTMIKLSLKALNNK